MTGFDTTNIFERLESEVRSYCRTFPAVFEKASGPFLFDIEGKKYIDFFCGAGALSYGHNPPELKQHLIDYLTADGIAHGLDLATRAKAEFIAQFESTILLPRALNYRIQFTGPTGANAVEAALKLSRKIKHRSNVVSFTNAYHGLSLGALAVTANVFYRDEAFVNRTNVSFMPFDGYFGPGVNTIEYLNKFVDDESSGLDWPAAVILETVQAEGGINVASREWLRNLDAVCRKHDIVLIVDDIQAGCGRTGTFFSFEDAGITPDIVVLSKAISGFGLPMALLLIRPDFDRWKPGEHTGTFRGNNLAFVTATQALRFWETPELANRVIEASAVLREELGKISMAHQDLRMNIRGRGLIYGIEIPDKHFGEAISQECFKHGLVLETCGGGRNVLKLLPPLNISRDVLLEGIEILARCVTSVCG